MSSDVRRARPADRGTVEDIVEQAYQPWITVIGARPGPMDADYAALIAAGSVYVTGSSAVDGLIVLVPENDALLIDNVAVDPDRQGRGIGRTLLAFAETAAQQRGLQAVRLFTHERMTRNIKLYQDLGYAITGYERIDLAHLVHMRKPVHPPAMARAT